MPAEDVSDLRDVVDAINKLCETMKTSYDEYEDCEDDQVSSIEVEEDSYFETAATASDREKLKPLPENTKIYESEKTTQVTEKLSDTYFKTVVMASDREKLKSLPENTKIYESQKTTQVDEKLKPLAENTKIYESEKTTQEAEKLNDTYFETVVKGSDREKLKPLPENREIYESEETSRTIFETVEATSKSFVVKSTTQRVETYVAESETDIETVGWAQEPANIYSLPPVSEMEVEMKYVEPYIAERWCDRVNEDIELVVSDSEPVVEPHPCEPISEMYYTASSEVSLLSDMDAQDKAQSEDSDKEKDDRNSVMAGHVAAMRERFESMTRTNTPCPDLIRSASPSFEVFRNISTSPDRLE